MCLAGVPGISRPSAKACASINLQGLMVSLQMTVWSSIGSSITVMHCNYEPNALSSTYICACYCSTQYTASCSICRAFSNIQSLSSSCRCKGLKKRTHLLRCHDKHAHQITVVEAQHCGELSTN